MSDEPSNSNAMGAAKVVVSHRVSARDGKSIVVKAKMQKFWVNE